MIGGVYFGSSYPAGSTQGAVTFTLAADVGSFALTGVASSILANRQLTGDPASFVLTGSAFNRGYQLSFDPATFTLTGFASSESVGKFMQARIRYISSLNVRGSYQPEKALTGALKGTKSVKGSQ